MHLLLPIMAIMIIFTCPVSSNIAYAYQQPKLIMIDPAGHAKNPGRRLYKGYERAETYKCAEALKKRLEKEFNVRVVLTRAPGDEIVPLQNASFANRLIIPDNHPVDFFLCINFYIQEAPKPKICLYNVVFDPIIDNVSRSIDPFAFVPVHQAHFKNIRHTTALAAHLASLLGAEQYRKSYDVSGPYGMPLKQLIGIIAPALVVEICLPSQDNQWEGLIDPLAQSLALALHISRLR